MSKRAFAIGCHPDDIEFGMAGTLLLLQKAGYEIHYMNVANGSCGTNKHNREDIVRIRREEAVNAAKSVGAVYHESLVDDLEVFYDKDTLWRLGSVVRDVEPEIILTQYPVDYMEDHMNTCRLAVSAAFCRGMTNFKANPPRKITEQDVTVYHSVPHSLTDQLRRPIIPGMFVDVSSVVSKKRDMLAMHKSQKEWLDDSQGMDSYLITMENNCRHMGKHSGKFEFAEGWTRHLHLGFSSKEYDPLHDVLKDLVLINEKFEASLR